MGLLAMQNLRSFQYLCKIKNTIICRFTVNIRIYLSISTSGIFSVPLPSHFYQDCI
jgi:hypothetical protein